MKTCSVRASSQAKTWLVGAQQCRTKTGRSQRQASQQELDILVIHSRGFELQQNCQDFYQRIQNMQDTLSRLMEFDTRHALLGNPLQNCRNAFRKRHSLGGDSNDPVDFLMAIQRLLTLISGQANNLAEDLHLMDFKNMGAKAELICQLYTEITRQTLSKYTQLREQTRLQRLSKRLDRNGLCTHCKIPTMLANLRRNRVSVMYGVSDEGVNPNSSFSSEQGGGKEVTSQNAMENRSVALALEPSNAVEKLTEILNLAIDQTQDQFPEDNKLPNVHQFQNRFQEMKSKFKCNIAKTLQKTLLTFKNTAKKDDSRHGQGVEKEVQTTSWQHQQNLKNIQIKRDVLSRALANQRGLKDEMTVQLKNCLKNIESIKGVVVSLEKNLLDASHDIRAKKQEISSNEGNILVLKSHLELSRKEKCATDKYILQLKEETFENEVSINCLKSKIEELKVKTTTHDVSISTNKLHGMKERASQTNTPAQPDRCQSVHPVPRKSQSTLKNQPRRSQLNFNKSQLNAVVVVKENPSSEPTTNETLLPLAVETKQVQLEETQLNDKRFSSAVKAPHLGGQENNKKKAQTKHLDKSGELLPKSKMNYNRIRSSKRLSLMSQSSNDRPHVLSKFVSTIAKSKESANNQVIPQRNQGQTEGQGWVQIQGQNQMCRLHSEPSNIQKTPRAKTIAKNPKTPLVPYHNKTFQRGISNIMMMSVLDSHTDTHQSIASHKTSNEQQPVHRQIQPQSQNVQSIRSPITAPYLNKELSEPRGFGRLAQESSLGVVEPDSPKQPSRLKDIKRLKPADQFKLQNSPYTFMSLHQNSSDPSTSSLELRQELQVRRKNNKLKLDIKSLNKYIRKTGKQWIAEFNLYLGTLQTDHASSFQVTVELASSIVRCIQVLSKNNSEKATYIRSELVKKFHRGQVINREQALFGSLLGFVNMHLECARLQGEAECSHISKLKRLILDIYTVSPIR